MLNYYTLEEKRNELKKDLIRKELFLDGWQKVKPLRKKDGTPFQNFKKNYEGVYWDNSLTSSGLIMKLLTHSDRTGYIRDDLYLYDRNHSFNVEETDNAIYKRIEELKKSIFSLNQQIEDFENNINALFEEITPIIEHYRGIADSYCITTNQTHSDTYYAMNDLICDTFRF